MISYLTRGETIKKKSTIAIYNNIHAYIDAKKSSEQLKFLSIRLKWLQVLHHIVLSGLTSNCFYESELT